MNTPVEIDGKWYAQENKVVFKDFLNNNLEFNNEAEAESWCYARGEVVLALCVHSKSQKQKSDEYWEGRRQVENMLQRENYYRKPY